MNIEKIRKRLPGGFIPFILRTSDEREFKVPHPEFILISPKGSLAVVDDDGDINLLDTLHIVSLKELKTAKANGATNS